MMLKSPTPQISSFQGRNVVVTGASGFIGSHVAKLLAGEGAKLVLPVREAGLAGVRAKFPSAQVPLTDLTDSAAVERALRGAESVFHVAGDYRFWAADPREIFRNNVEGTRNVLAAAWKLGIERTICTGTPGIFQGRMDGTPADESVVIGRKDCTGPYKESKWLAFQEAEGFALRGLPLVHVFPTAPIGEGDHRPTPTGRILHEFLKGRMPMLARTGLNFVDVRSAAAGHLLVAKLGENGGRYLLGGENLWLREYLQRAGALCGRSVSRVDCPHALRYLAAWFAEKTAALRGGGEPFVTLEGVRMSRRPHFFDCRRAERELGFERIGIERALAAALREFAPDELVSDIVQPGFEATNSGDSHSVAASR